MGLRDLFRRTPRPAAEQAAPLALSLEEQVRHATEQAVQLVSPGFMARAAAESQLVDIVADDPGSFPDLDQRRVGQIVAQVWRERLAIEATWPDQGDYPALVAAFEDLEAHGIVARMGFACCQTCGHAEIGDEAGPGARGYTFFHQQDADRLAPLGTDLFLSFGAFDADRTLDADLLARSDAGAEDARRQVLAQTEQRIAAEVAATLTRHGLVVEWDGSVGSRIRLPRVDWRKRLPTA